MKKILYPIVKSSELKSGKLLTVYRIEVALVLVLAALLIFGSLFALFRPKTSDPVIRFGETSANAGRIRGGTNAGDNNISVFNGLGRLRISVPAANASEAPSTLIVSIAFPYPSEDQAFQEELASNVRNFKDITVSYFSSLSTGALLSPDEDLIKADLLKRYNALLRLGKIHALYFNELMVVE